MNKRKITLKYILYKLFQENQSPFKLREAWLNTQANNWLKDYIQPEHEVLEFGGGASTLFFSDNCLSVHTIETDPTFIHLIKSKLRKRNVLFTNKPIKKYDIILVDSNNDRIKEFETAKQHLKQNGIIIFDNFDRYDVKEKPSLLFKDYANQQAGITTTAIFECALLDGELK